MHELSAREDRLDPEIDRAKLIREYYLLFIAATLGGVTYASAKTYTEYGEG